MPTPHPIVTIVGSLRKESFTLKIANALAKLAPASLKLDVTTLHGISFFNQDLEAAPPADWLAFREKLQKPIGIVSNSPGPLGGVSAAKHLQNILPGICGPILGQPEVYLNGIGDAFDDKGNLTKESMQKVLQQYLDAFAAFIERQNK